MTRNSLSLFLAVAISWLGSSGYCQETPSPTESAIFSEAAIDAATGGTKDESSVRTDPLDGIPEIDGEGLVFNFRGVDLDVVLDYLSKAAGFVIVREEEIEGEVDVLSHQPLTKDEAVLLLNAILMEKGYTAIRNGRVLTIVDRDDAAKRDLPVMSGRDPREIPRSDMMVTQVIPIRYADAQKLIDNLEPLIPSYATLTANESSNAIVLTDTQANVRRIAQIIEALDTSISSISALQVFVLRYADATDLARVVNEIFRSDAESARSNGGARMESFFSRMRGGADREESSDSIALRASARVVAVADEQTNSLVISAPDELMPAVAELVKQIDTFTEDITELRVFLLRYSAAKEMATLITQVFQPASQVRGANQTRRNGRGRPNPGPTGNGGQPSARKLQEESVTAVADSRTNSVVVTATGGTMLQIEKMVQALDADPSKEKRVYVHELENANAEQVAEILRGMFQGNSGGGRTTTNRSNTNRTGAARTNQRTTGNRGSTRGR